MATKTSLPAHKNIKERLGERLMQIRMSKGLTQLRVAVECKLDRGYISMLEHGKYSPSYDVLHRLASCYSTKVSKMVEGID